MIRRKPLPENATMSVEHILLLENEKGLERILTLLLKQANFKVTRYHKAETAMAGLASLSDIDQTNLLIIDIPEINCEGSKLLQQLDATGSTLPRIVIIPYGNEGLFDIQDNHSHLLCTPFEPVELMNCIDQITRNKRSSI